MSDTSDTSNSLRSNQTSPSAPAPTRRPRWIAAAFGGLAIGMTAIGAVAFVGRHDPTTTNAQRTAPIGSTVAPAPTKTPSGPGSSSRTITVSGEGTVKVKPDTATAQFGVNVARPTATAALDEANQRAAALIAALKSAGITDDDIVTSGLSVYPRYDNSGVNQISGYNASNSVSVTVRNIDRTGPVIDAATKATGEAVTLGGVSFSVSDREQVIGAARTDAIANAVKRAGEYAKAAGAGVGAVLQISEVAVSPMPVFYGAATTVAAGADGRAPTPVQSGTQDLSVTVTVVYALA